MDRMGKEEVVRFYRWHLRDFGDTPMGVRWTEEGQKLRYEKILQCMGDPSGKRLLDFGCGKGDFYGFLKGRGYRFDYTGIDITPELVELGRRKFPTARFEVLDIEEEGLREDFDIVVVIGTFNLRVAGIKDTFRTALKILYSHAREAVHLNCLSSVRKTRDPELFMLAPDELVAFVSGEITGRFRLLHGEVEGEMFLSLYK